MLPLPFGPLRARPVNPHTPGAAWGDSSWRRWEKREGKNEEKNEGQEWAVEEKAENNLEP